MTGIFPKNKLLTAEEVAPVLNIKASTVMEWALTGKIPSLKLTGGRKGVVRFNGRKLNEWLEEKERVSRNKKDKNSKITRARKIKKNKNIMQDYDDFVESLGQI